jgi:chromosome partitioning protein
MEVVVIVNRKGGVGKTATVQALGAGLQQKGYKVLFIDLDSQANLTYGTGADPEAPTSLHVLTGEATAKEAIQKTPQGDIIAASALLATADAIINETGKEYRLKEALASVKKAYDYILIDTPASLGILTINALTASNSALIPVQADAYSLQGIAQINDTVTTVKKYCNKDLKINGIIINRYNGRSTLSKDYREGLAQIAKELKTKLYSTPIRECIAVKEAQALKTDIFTYAPKSNAASDYADFVSEFLKEGGKR